MLVFPKSIANPAAEPKASFAASKTTVPATGATANGSFAKALATTQAGAKSAAVSSAQASTVAAQAASASTTAPAGSATSAGGATTSATSGGADSVDAAQSEDRFLTLLLAQMKNQDPLNPLDNAQVTTQLAQISTVSGIEKLNTSLGALVTKLSASGPVDGAGMIGKRLLVEGDTLELGGDDSAGAAGGFQLDAAAPSVRVEVYGEGTEPVRTLTLDGSTTGVRTFEWDGKDSQGNRLTEGTYRFRATAISGTSEVPAVGLSAERVTGVVRSDAGYQLQTTSGRVFAQDVVRGVM